MENNPEKNQQEKMPELQFPLTFDIKIIVSSEIPEEITKENINKVFNKVMIPNHFIDIKASSKGKYWSYNYSILLLDHDQMIELYDEIKNIEGFKIAL